MSKRTVITKKPFLSVVSDSRLPELTKVTKKETPPKVSQSINHEELSVEELTQQVKMLKTGQEQVLYTCHNGSDEVSHTVLVNLLRDIKTPKLDRVRDKNAGNCSLMHLCAMKNKPICMEYLAQEHKVKLESLDNIEATPLLHAVANNSVEATTFLLSKGVNVNHRDIWGKFPLLIALKNRNYSMAEILLSQKSIDVHMRGVKGNTVLHIMAAEGDLRAVQFLIERAQCSPQRRNGDEENVLQVGLPFPEIVQYLCAKMDRKIVLKMLMNINIAGCSIVHDCARSGCLDSLLIILKCLDISELTPYQVTTLLNSVNRENDTPLLVAVKQMQPAMVKFLCQCSEIKLNEGDVDGNTALFHAGALKNTEIIDMLTAVNASLKADNHDDDDEKRQFVIACCTSLKTLLACILFFIAFACIVTISAISLGFFASNVSKSAASIRRKHFDQTITHVGRQFQDISLSEKMSFLNGRFNLTDEVDVMEYTAPIFFTFIKRMPLVNLVYCTLADNSLAYWTKGGNATFPTVSWASNYANKTQMRTYRGSLNSYSIDNYRDLFAIATPTYSRTTVTTQPQRAYITTASLHNDTIWTLSYPSSNGGTMYLTVGHGIFDGAGTFLGSCQFDTTTTTITEYIKEQTASQENSVTVIVERQTGYLIGTSDPDVKLFTVQANTTNVVRIDGTNSANKRLSAMLKYAQSKFGGKKYPKIRAQQVYTRFYFNGEQNALNIGSVSDAYGLDWIVLQAYPMKNFYGLFYNSIIIMVCATVALLVISLLVSIFVAHIFMKPINYLIMQAEAIKLLQLEKVEQHLKERSFFSEIQSLQVSFKSMTVRLKQFRNFIPDHILAVIEAEIGSAPVPVKNGSELQSSNPSEKNVKTQSGSATASITNDTPKQKNIVNKALSSTLVSGAVTVMVIKFPDYAQTLELYSAEDIDTTTKELLSNFMDIIRISKGQFVSISSSKAVVAWNTFIKQSDHKLRACKTARQCMDAMTKLQIDWRNKNLPIIDVSIAISSGNLYYGNMGTDRMKFFTLIGPSVQRAAKMGKNTWGAPIVIDEKVAESVKEEYRVRPLYTVSEGGNDKDILIYELGENKPSDAWANDLGESKDGTNAWKTYCDAFELFQASRYDDAYEQFIQFLENHPSDTATQNMLALCKQQKDEVTPSATLSDNTTTLVDN